MILLIVNHNSNWLELRGNYKYIKARTVMLPYFLHLLSKNIRFHNRIWQFNLLWSIETYWFLTFRNHRPSFEPNLPKCNPGIFAKQKCRVQCIGQKPKQLLDEIILMFSPAVGEIDKKWKEIASNPFESSVNVTNSAGRS